jgi:hypothetical protein
VADRQALWGQSPARTDRRLGALFSVTMRAFCTRRDEHSAPVVLHARSARFAYLRGGADRQFGSDHQRFDTGAGDRSMSAMIPR